MRIPNMKQGLALLLGCCVIMAGCAGDNGGGGGYYVGIGSVSGVVFDQNGFIVRNAQVFYNSGGPGNQNQTLSNSKGAYILRGLPALDDVIQCQLTSNGVSYFGQNLARLNSGQRTMTVNIALYPTTQLATLQGTVGNNLGQLLYGAKVYAIPASGAFMSSAVGVTDYTGHFAIGGLLAGVAYNIQANGPGYGSATDTETLVAGQAKTVAYTIPPATTTTLAPPTNVSVVAYTSPGVATSQPKLRNAIEAVKNIMNPARRLRPAIKKPITSNGAYNPIEIDVVWSPINNNSLLGYGIYRSANMSQPTNSVGFMSDPLASIYEDMDPVLTSGTTYTYAVTTVSTSYNGNQGESAQSATASATPLGPLALGSVTATTMPTFNWQAATGAATYAIFLFSQYPDIGVNDIYDNFSSQVSTTSYTYTGQGLTSGQTYYYLVVGYDAAGDESLSPVGQFTVN